MQHQKKLNEVLVTSRMYMISTTKKPWLPLKFISKPPPTSPSSLLISDHYHPLAGPPPTNMTTDYGEPSSAVLKLLEWVNVNVLQPRPFRSPQLYLWGPPATGKTSFLRLLDTMLRIYYFPSEAFYDHYNDDDYDLIVMDEFGPTHDLKPMQEYNKWLDGQVMSIRKKGSQGLKTKNLPFIICSNYPPERVYHKVFGRGELQPFLSRLTVVEVEEMIPVDQIVPTGLEEIQPVLPPIEHPLCPPEGTFL